MTASITIYRSLMVLVGVLIGFGGLYFASMVVAALGIGILIGVAALLADDALHGR